MAEPSPSGGGRRRGRGGSGRTGGGGNGGGGNGGGGNGEQQSRRRKRKPAGRSGGGGGGNGGGGNGNGFGNRSRGHRQGGMERLVNPTHNSADGHSVLGGRELAAGEGEQLAMDGFGLFCAYHLGITQEDGYRKPNLDSVARRFGVSPEDVQQSLKEHSLDQTSITNSRFDLVGAQLDIRLAPEGISRTEAARGLYDEFIEMLEEA